MSYNIIKGTGSFLIVGEVVYKKQYLEPIPTSNFRGPVLWLARWNILGIRQGEFEDRLFRAVRYKNLLTGWITQVKNREPLVGDKVLAFLTPQNRSNDNKPVIEWLEVLNTGEFVVKHQELKKMYEEQ